MNVPHYINENKSDMRGIKPGWYMMRDDGDLSSGPFYSHAECLSSDNQPKESTSSESLPRPMWNNSAADIWPACRR
jgi:hypothetical protein